MLARFGELNRKERTTEGGKGCHDTLVVNIDVECLSRRGNSHYGNPPQCCEQLREVDMVRREREVEGPVSASGGDDDSQTGEGSVCVDQAWVEIRSMGYAHGWRALVKGG